MRSLRWLFLFFLCCLALRWGSFFISVINHDESTYIVIADELLRGETYLRDVIDTKPIGIFLIYAALIKLTGGSLLALRLAASGVVALGAWGLCFATRRATGNARAGGAAGLIYCFACSVFTYYGLSPNTEIFFNVLTIAAVALAVAPRVRTYSAAPFWHWPAAGLLLGIAMLIKPFAAAEALAVGLFAVWHYRQNVGKMLAAGLALTGAFALPLFALWLSYRQAQLLEVFYFYTFTVSGAYPIELPWYLRLKYMGDYLLRYLPFVLLGLQAVIVAKRSSMRAGSQVRGKEQEAMVTSTWFVYLLVQFLTVTTVVLLTGKRFGHYQVQLHPVIALFAACWWATRPPGKGWWRSSALRRWGGALLAVLFLGIGTAHFFRYRKKVDHPRIVADYLNTVLQPGETYFGINGWQIAYHLTDRPVPTPYVHSSLLYLDHHVRAFQIDEQAEAERILSDASVQYLVGRTVDEEAQTPLTFHLLEAFRPYTTLEHDIMVWKRR